MNPLRILLLGDIVGAAGRAIFQKHIASLRSAYRINGLIVNGENSSADGRGITSRTARFFKHHHVDVITSGNHIWHYRDIYDYLAHNNDLLRPANYPGDCPGVGVTTFICDGVPVGVINVQGRVFMRDNLACPFREAQSLVQFLRTKTPIIIVDFHAEASSEKMGLGFFLDGSVSAVVGTHTHVQTADERILPKGTAFMTDLGMAGSLHSMIGMKKEPIIENFLTQMPVKFSVEMSNPMILCGAVIEIDRQTGKALSIERIRLQDDAVTINENDQ